MTAKSEPTSRPAIARHLSSLGRLWPTNDQRQIQQALEAGWRIDTPDQYCRRCGATIGKQAVTEKGCPFCLKQSIAWDRLFRLSAYQDPMAGWIVQMKFSGVWAWAKWLGRQLAEKVRGEFNNGNGSSDCDPEQNIVVPVPMHWLRRWSRGFNQAQLIAESFANAQSWKVAPLLKRTRRTAAQTTVMPSQRTRNIAGSIEMHNVDLSGWDIWLVDDVKTTGSTLSLCARMLRKAGARSINVAVAAVADPKHADFQVI